MGILPVCMSMYHMYAVLSKGDRATEVDVIDGVSCHVDPENGPCLTLNG